MSQYPTRDVVVFVPHKDEPLTEIKARLCVVSERLSVAQKAVTDGWPAFDRGMALGIMDCWQSIKHGDDPATALAFLRMAVDHFLANYDEARLSGWESMAREAVAAYNREVAIINAEQEKAHGNPTVQ